MPSTFKYRFVNFGTVFSAGHGNRSPDDGGGSPNLLYKNELAMDVGGVCWGYQDEQLAVIDHHFQREGQFPSASAAVLHKAGPICKKFSSDANDVIWLVTHKQPDFDAFCSMYLARCILEDARAFTEWEQLGLDPNGWLNTANGLPDGHAGVQEINWFEPDTLKFPPGVRWQILLAAYASCLDNSRHLSCPKTRSPHSVLYAAIERGRDYFNEDSGAVEFFEEVGGAIRTKGLNPLFDSVLEESESFAPELAMLDRESNAYARDLRRARKALVDLQQATTPFRGFFPGLRAKPLLNPDLTPNREHLSPHDQVRSQVDGIYIRDPECLLFKDWARTDIENSSMGMGFVFTAVAISGDCPGGLTNKTAYFFAVDPERAAGRHLYSVWARLQSAEIQSLHRPECAKLKRQLEEAEDCARVTSKRTNCRHGFEERAGSFKAFFDDPWYDGSNYGCTIIATPNRGTLIGGPGLRADLLDDRIVSLVRNELELSVYTSRLRIADLSTSPAGPDQPEWNCEIAEAEKLQLPPPRSFRFGQIQLDDGLNILSGDMAQQIGTTLWKVLHPDAGEGTPTDFSQRHLVKSSEWVGIWSRRGIMIAYKRDASEKTETLKNTFRELIALSREVESLAKIQALPNELEALEEIARRADRLMRREALLKQDLALPDNRLLSRFFEATQLGEVLEMLRELYISAATQIRKEKVAAQTQGLATNTATVAEVQVKLEWIEIFFVSFYATELAYVLSELLDLDHKWAVPFVCVVAVVFTGAALWLLKPWKHREWTTLFVIFALLLVLWCLGILANWTLPSKYKKAAEPKNPYSFLMRQQ